MTHILVTGGAGYIGSHTVLELVQQGYRVSVVDNLCNASAESLRRVGDLTGKADQIRFHNVDICDETGLNKVFQEDTFAAVIHFAALKSVGQSTAQPLEYYKNNVTGTLTLLSVMGRHNCRTLIFSSSATVYGTAPIPYTEGSTVGVGIPSPYGHTKFVVEEILRDLSAVPTEGWRFMLLRYFNPVGAHPSGKIGEDPNGVPQNVMPFLTQVAVGRLECLNVFGGDYDTPDGTCRRDYIHVVDLAQGHVAALRKALDTAAPLCKEYNLGSGSPLSVLELIRAMERACGHAINFKIADRRKGDLPQFWAATDKAKAELQWQTTKSIDDMCRDAYNWQRNNPMGYR